MAALVVAALALSAPLLLFNPDFAVGRLQYVELWGGAVAMVLAAASVGGAVWYLAGAAPATGVCWSACGSLATLIGVVGWVVAGAMGLLAVVPLAAASRTIGRRSLHGSGTALLGATLVSVAFLCGKLVLSGRPAPPPRQLVIIGIDAATWDIIDRLRAVGRMPIFDRLIHEGARGELDTVFPVISPPLWASIATGKTPEKHGIKDFWGGSEQVQAKPLWEIADDHGLTSGVLGYLVTWPPHKQGGFLVPGWDAQGPETIPPELGFLKRLEIGEKQGAQPSVGERIALVAAALRHGATLSTLNAALGGMITRRLGVQGPLEQALETRLLKLYLTTDVFCQLLRSVEPQLAIYYYSSVDAIQHQYFKYYAPEGFNDLTPQSIADYRDAIPRAYEEVDKAVGRILRAVAPAANVMIVSDHGQRPVRREGAKWYRIKTTKLLGHLGLTEKVRATNMGSEVYLRPAGSPADFAAALASIRSVVTVGDDQPLLSVEQHSSGEALVTVHPAVGDTDGRAVRLGERMVLVRDLLDGSERISGEHTETAIVLLAGPDIAAATSIPRGSVLDVTPTALALLGLPLARDMDGKILSEAFRPGVSERAVTYVDTYGAPARARKGEEGIREHKLEQLKALGYVE